MSFQTTNQKQNHVLTTTLEEKNESHDSSQSKPKYHVNGSKKNGRLQKHPASTRETPEKVLIEEPRATVSTIKGSDLLLLKKLDIDGRNQKPRNTYRRKYNDQLITYSQPPLTNGITTLTQTSGVRMSTGLTSTSSNQWDKGPVEKKPEVVVQTIYKPTEVTETIHFPRVYKKSGFRLSRAELVRRCNHDVARMIGKKFLDDQVCTKPRLIKLFLKAAVRGDVEQFKQLFDMSFQHARTVKCFENCSDIALKRIFMLFIPCNKLENKHGYCQLIAFICQFFKPSELKIIFELRNSYSGRTALCIAAVAGNLCQMKVLLENGANPNTFDFLGYSPLYYAIKKSRKDM
uniref:Uncharacterized protein n=1 Tax=Panagrolaimus sp. JU765 TaxID=591449 RepID=A0AC34Q800_9BILA